MADKDEKKDKKPGTIKQIIQIFKYTYKEDKQLPWLLAGVILAPVVVGVVLGLIFQWNWLNWIFIMAAFIMLGLLFGTMTLTNRADKVGYRQLEGRPGAAISVLSNMNKAGFTFPEQPVWIDARTKDAIWRGTGYNGIYLLGEGNYTNVKRNMERQEHAIKGVTAGSSIPVYRIIVGTGENETRLKDLRKTITRQKSYVPTNHSNALMRKLHPRRRFMLTKEELGVLNDRLRTLQQKSGYGIPKGIDPNRMQKVSRRAMRGR
ncbi:DUF4191 domain-containing protein [Bifidobacterium sp. CP2]|uniref:DUF4191 domain-containing protein n=1 Tax=Bifidobacterium TaxID=1678 RepID=UPI001BDDBFE5|nr:MULTISPECIES: DUF4191 domain-containing protein [Bifidobacterium]MBT1182056.1 DUF4191 domain-containing protein [Bifidobacterium sp. CP2]MBW3080765.1 DUF4191 domain-containing protein [Bifidobacterium saguinibicoloris]